MGNENAKEIDLVQPDGTVHEKCQNGGVNGISLTITANGHTVEVPSKIPAEIDVEPPLPEVKVDPTEYAVLESQSEPAEAEDVVQAPEPSVVSEEVPPKEERVSLFSKMFKKKTETEKLEEPDKDEQQLPNGETHEKEENGLTANDDGIQAPPAATLDQTDQSESTAYAVLESQSEPTEAEVTVPTPDLSVISEEVPAKKGKVSLFNKMFKKKNNPTPEKETEKEELTDTSSTSDHQQENGEILEEQEKADVDLPEPTSPEEVRTAEYVVLESQSEPTEAEAPVQTPDPSVPSEEDPPREERVSLFSKMFKKKTAPAPAPAAEKEKEPEEKTEEKPEETNEEQTDAGDQQLETAGEQTPDPDSGPEQTEEEESELDGGSANIVEESQDSPEEENPVMNFFKTLVTPTKTSKKEAAAAPKDQPQPPESQPAPATTTTTTTTTTVAQVCDPPAAPKGMPAPPPPPPEPPRAEPAAKAKQEEPKPAAKDSPKGKSASNTLTRFFRSKTKHDDPPPSAEEAEAAQDQQENPVEAPQPVTDDQTDSHVDAAEESVDTEDQEQKPDASKASTLEAAAKPAPAPAAAQEEKKPEAKKSLLSFFKPKALLDTVSAAVQAASTSGVELLRKSRAAAAEPKAAPAPAATAAEAGPSKEDAPKAAKSTEAPAEAKPAAAAPSGGEEAASAPKKMEKRNSITLFFKNLSQRRSSTDAAAQTEAAPAPSAEKTK